MVSEPLTHVTQMASSSLNTSDAVTNGNPPLVSPPAINVTKLSKDNYHVWKAQLMISSVGKVSLDTLMEPFPPHSKKFPWPKPPMSPSTLSMNIGSDKMPS